MESTLPEEKHTHEHVHQSHHKSTPQSAYTAQEVKTLLAWHAPSRPHRKRAKEYYVNSMLIVLALEVILVLFKEYMLMLVIMSVAFVSYALSATEPDPLYCRISTEGIAVGDHYYLWQELYDFYFKQRSGMDILHIRTKTYLPGELILVLGDVTKDQIQQVLLAFLPYREVVHATFTEKAGEWVAESFPLERPRHHVKHHTAQSHHDVASE
jgi:hypothetical protein